MRKLYEQDIREILYGATLLGAGGGGSLAQGLGMLENLKKSGEIIELDMLDVDEIGDNEYAAMAAGLGSPVAMLDPEMPPFGPDAVYAFRAFQKAFLAEGKECKYLYSGEMGGFNTFVPMLVAILSDKDPAKRIKFLDVDSNGRAVPELNTTLCVYLRPPAQAHGPRQPERRRGRRLSRDRPQRRADCPQPLHALQHAHRLRHLGPEQG